MTSFSAEITSRNDQQLSLEDAIALVHSHASQTWRDKADQVVRNLCATRETFTADDVLEGLSGVECPDNRALGAVMRNAQAEGLCRATGAYVPSRLPQRNMRPIRVWMSLPRRA